MTGHIAPTESPTISSNSAPAAGNRIYRPPEPCASMPCRKSERIASIFHGRRNTIRQSLLVALRVGAARRHSFQPSDVAAVNRQAT